MLTHIILFVDYYRSRNTMLATAVGQVCDRHGHRHQYRQQLGTCKAVLFQETNIFFGLLFEFIVITGASDGIGKEFAFQLASKKMNIVLVSRTQSKLVALAEELRKNHLCRALRFSFSSTESGRFRLTNSSCLLGL